MKEINWIHIEHLEKGQHAKTSSLMDNEDGTFRVVGGIAHGETIRFTPKDIEKIMNATLREVDYEICQLCKAEQR